MTTKQNKTQFHKKIVDSELGHPINEWIVTLDMDESLWGEGYVIHAIDPFLIYKWGYTKEGMNQAMSAGIKVQENEYLSVLIANRPKQLPRGFDQEKYSIKALGVLSEYLIDLSDEQSNEGIGP